MWRWCICRGRWFNTSDEEGTAAEGEGAEEVAVGSMDSGASFGAMTEASRRARFDESFDDDSEFLFEDRSKKTGRKVSVSWNTWSWLSLELFSWEFMGKEIDGRAAEISPSGGISESRRNGRHGKVDKESLGHGDGGIWKRDWSKCEEKRKELTFDVRRCDFFSRVSIKKERKHCFEMRIVSVYGDMPPP